MSVRRRGFLGLVAGWFSVLAAPLGAQESRSRDGLKEPLLRTSKRSVPEKASTPAVADDTKGPHPLDEAIAIAEEALERIRSDIADYKCVMVKRERVQGKLGDQEFMYAKIRNRKVKDDKIVVPFAVYLYFVKPESVKGRECAYVEGKNDGKMQVKETGLAGKLIPILSLPPDGLLAMRGNLYPITEAGIENLIVKLLEKGRRDRKREECRVDFRENATINGRSCRLMEVVHPVRRAYFDFNLAQIYLDSETGLPIRYAAFTWPTGKDSNPNPKPNDRELIEEYTYMKLELNPGFTDDDFKIKDGS